MRHSCPVCRTVPPMEPVIEADGKHLTRSVGGLEVKIYSCVYCGFIAQFIAQFVESEPPEKIEP